MRPAALPPVHRWLRPLVRFLHTEAAGGVVLLFCTAVALALANSSAAPFYADFWHARVGLTAGEWSLVKPLEWWINDGLMVLFFFVVGLEIKRELVAGELRDPRKAALPAAAALGGMIVPAAVYLLLQKDTPGARGWGVPMATDIAFVVGALALLGRRVPVGLKVLMLTLAIVDDLGAVLVIALAYTPEVSLQALGAAAVGFGLVLALRLAGARVLALFAVLGLGIWLAFVLSGVHPTVAGVLLGLLTPSHPILGRQRLRAAAAVVAQFPEGQQWQGDGYAVQQLAEAAREAISPLDRLETALHPWVAFVIVPLFALANAGVAIDLAQFRSPVALAVALGLVVGKPLGIVLFGLAAVKLGLARLPAGVNVKVLIGAGCLGGIGFTMSLFVCGLALEGELLRAGKVGTLLGSLVSAVLGAGLLVAYLPAAPSPPAPSSKEGEGERKGGDAIARVGP